METAVACVERRGCGGENTEHRTQNREQRTENREQRTENREQGTENKHEGTKVVAVIVTAAAAWTGNRLRTGRCLRAATAENAKGAEVS
jgi:hypothetical protein